MGNWCGKAEADDANVQDEPDAVKDAAEIPQIVTESHDSAPAVGADRSALKKTASTASNRSEPPPVDISSVHLSEKPLSRTESCKSWMLREIESSNRKLESKETFGLFEDPTSGDVGVRQSAWRLPEQSRSVFVWVCSVGFDSETERRWIVDSLNRDDFVDNLVKQHNLQVCAVDWRLGLSGDALSAKSRERVAAARLLESLHQWRSHCVVLFVHSQKYSSVYEDEARQILANFPAEQLYVVRRVFFNAPTTAADDATATSTDYFTANPADICKLEALGGELSRRIPVDRQYEYRLKYDADRPTPARGDEFAVPLLQACRDLIAKGVRRIADQLSDEEETRDYGGVSRAIYSDIYCHWHRLHAIISSAPPEFGLSSTSDIEHAVKAYLSSSCQKPLVVYPEPDPNLTPASLCVVQRRSSHLLASCVAKRDELAPDSAWIFRFRIGVREPALECLHSLLEQIAALYSFGRRAATQVFYDLVLRGDNSALARLLTDIPTEKPLVIVLDNVPLWCFEQLQLPSHVKLLLRPASTAKPTMAIEQQFQRLPVPIPPAAIKAASTGGLSIAALERDYCSATVRTLLGALALASESGALSLGELYSLLNAGAGGDDADAAWHVVVRLKHLGEQSGILLSTLAAQPSTSSRLVVFTTDWAHRLVVDYLSSGGPVDEQELYYRQVLDDCLSSTSLTTRARREGSGAGVESMLKADFIGSASTTQIFGEFERQHELDINDDSSSENAETLRLETVLTTALHAALDDGGQLSTQIHHRLGRSSTAEGASHALEDLRLTLVKNVAFPYLSSASCLTTPTNAPASDIASAVDRSEIMSTPTKGGSRHRPTLIRRIPGHPNLMTILNEEGGCVTIFDFTRNAIVRQMDGVARPKDIRFLDSERAVLLSNREMKVYSLSEGRQISTLKGVMNQQRPYYGVHTEGLIVALSRNRMYINMYDIKSGGVTMSFKAGEDRFLNSLLVSRNGHRMVCGDETQKPFPLLVWDLVECKLIYDLRQANHEFVTEMSAIDDDGHYVACVCQELRSTEPNFIVVYDLQSGTLFKKWKPGSPTTALSIASATQLVVLATKNCSILIYDLMSGSCKHVLRLHNHPARSISISEDGRRCLTWNTDENCMRLWDIESGSYIGGFTPDVEVSCAELNYDGQCVVFGVNASSTIYCLSTLPASGADSLAQMARKHTEPYGSPDVCYVDLRSAAK